MGAYRYLATTRNKLVHEREFNSIPDRAEFLRRFQAAEKELKAMLKRDSSSRCIVC